MFEATDPYIWVRTLSVLAATAIVSSGFVLLLGVPTYFLLRVSKRVSFRSALLAGFSLAAIPFGIF